MTDEELARLILSQVCVGSQSSAVIALAAQCKEWPQVGIQALCEASNSNFQVRPELVQEALDRWPDDMGPTLAERFAKLLEVRQPSAA